MRLCPIFLVGRRRSMLSLEWRKLAKGSRQTGCGSCQCVPDMSGWSKVGGLMVFKKKFFYQKWCQRAHLRSRSCGICYWGWRVLVRVRHACAVCLMVQMARHGEPITTMRWSWAWSRLDRRVRVFYGCVWRVTVSTCLPGAVPRYRR